MTRHVGSALLAAGSIALAACTGGAGPASASQFCQQARVADRLDHTIQAMPERNTSALRDAWKKYVSEVSDAAGFAPVSLRHDYAVYAAWITAFDAALERNGYQYASALIDEQFAAATSDGSVSSARASVASYLEARCRSGVGPRQ